jgi:hypothetical protein
MNTPDWDACIELLAHRCEQAIVEFLSEHQHEIIAFFAINVDYEEGFFGFSFDTWSNSVHVAQQDYQEAILTRRRLLGLARGWENARSYVLNNPVAEYNADIGLFTYLNFRELLLPELTQFYSADSLEDEHDLEGHTIRLCWIVLDTIYSRNPFQMARTSLPLRLGFFFQESDLKMVVTHLLRWPEASH